MKRHLTPMELECGASLDGPSENYWRERAETAERDLAQARARVEELEKQVAAQREEDARIADIERDCAATDLHDARQDEHYGRGQATGGNFDAGRKAAAEHIATAIRGNHG